MATKDQENEAIVETLEQREAGVTELLELYAAIEAVYAVSVRALEEGHTSMASTSTNRE